LSDVSRQSARFGKRITPSYINRIENDPTRKITADRLNALASGLGVPAQELFARAIGDFAFGKETKMKTDPPYRTDLINAAMGAQRLSNAAVAKRAGVGVMTVSKVRNGFANVEYLTLKKVAEAIGLTIAEVSETEKIT
jgi:transcriptional regulator with XRE-family HTH domain